MKRATFFSVFCLVFLLGVQSSLVEVYECELPKSLRKEIAGYQEFVYEITRTTLIGNYSGKFYNDLAAFVDKFGNRLAGTQNLENSIDFIKSQASKRGLDVRKEPVTVPSWTRGKESARLISPREKDLRMLGLGFSPGTSEAGITAEVIVVSNFEELQNRSEEVKGKIVLFNNIYASYGQNVKYRTQGPAAASKLGAVASLVRSVTPFSLYSPHTGTTRFRDAKPIPAACITLEDADMLARMHKAGQKIVVELKMGAKSEGNKTSHNLIFDFKGESLPNNYVTVSGHIDSWDVGEGALDDGVGAFLALHSIYLLKFMNVTRPRRTIRGIMWTAEEQGLIGANAYLEAHKNELKNWTAAMESDAGLYIPFGMSFNGTEEAYCIMKEIMHLFKELNATAVKKNPDVGSDIAVFRPYGVPLLDPLDMGSNYMWFHHTDGDSMRTQDSGNMDKNLAMFAAVSYILADLTIPLPRKGQSVWEMVRTSKAEMRNSNF